VRVTKAVPLVSLTLGRALSNGMEEPDYFFVKRGKTMKRVLGLILALSSMGFVVSADAKTTNASNENSTIAASSAPQWQRYRNYRRYDRRRSVTRSRYVRYGRRLYRETYVVTYWPNGRTDTRLISRQRVG
jgi:hypothetical protein